MAAACVVRRRAADLLQQERISCAGLHAYLREHQPACDHLIYVAAFAACALARCVLHAHIASKGQEGPKAGVVLHSGWGGVGGGGI